jgi:trehalose 6-phosphate synthase/phosphatase
MNLSPGENGRLVVVSNRLPVTLKRAGESWRTERSQGGLATAMGPLLKRTNGIWIGWSGDASGINDEKREELLKRWAERDRYFAVDLSPDIANGFYEGYSNQTLWPLFHHFPSQLRFDPKHWNAYVEANKLFRDVLLRHLRPDDIVWIHDYQLMLLPQLLRESMPQARIGFFLHIPFPTSAVFRLLPRREELLSGLLGADYIAFHTYGYLQHFRASLLRILGIETQMDQISIGDRLVKLDALPIGIAPESFTRLLSDDAETKTRLDEIRRRFADRHLLLGVDRLDYTKGIPERFRTFRRLLQNYPELREKVVLIQVAVPSRGLIPNYKQLRQEVDELVGEINGEFSTPEWTPIVYIRRGVPRSELVALYTAADVALVTPLRGGLNLVAKEYVACQLDDAGALVLSEFAGAAAEMGEAFLVNPYDEERTAETIVKALSMPEDELRDRMAALRQRVTRNNVFAWGERFVRNVAEASTARQRRASSKPKPLPVSEVVEAYRAATARTLLLDYDGTMVAYAPRPRDAAPTRALLDVLGRLSADPANRVIVVSGRSRADLERWMGNIQGLWLTAEHGALIRPPDSNEWEGHRPGYSNEWKERVRPILEHFVDRTPGSLIEEKEFSLVWHYRMSDPEFGQWLANELAANLESMLAETDLRALQGNKIVEVKPIWANKGEILNRFPNTGTEPDFILAAGDDRTDEDMFTNLPQNSWSVHVGDGLSKARYSLSNVAAMLSLLSEFAEATSEVSKVSTLA